MNGRIEDWTMHCCFKSSNKWINLIWVEQLSQEKCYIRAIHLNRRHRNAWVLKRVKKFKSLIACVWWVCALSIYLLFFIFMNVKSFAIKFQKWNSVNIDFEYVFWLAKGDFFQRQDTSKRCEISLLQFWLRD